MVVDEDKPGHLSQRFTLNDVNQHITSVGFAPTENYP